MFAGRKEHAFIAGISPAIRASRGVVIRTKNVALELRVSGSLLPKNEALKAS